MSYAHRMPGRYHHVNPVEYPEPTPPLPPPYLNESQCYHLAFLLRLLISHWIERAPRTILIEMPYAKHSPSSRYFERAVDGNSDGDGETERQLYARTVRERPSRMGAS